MKRFALELLRFSLVMAALALAAFGVGLLVSEDPVALARVLPGLLWPAVLWCSLWVVLALATAATARSEPGRFWPYAAELSLQSCLPLMLAGLAMTWFYSRNPWDWVAALLIGYAVGAALTALRRRLVSRFGHRVRRRVPAGWDTPPSPGMNLSTGNFFTHAGSPLDVGGKMRGEQRDD